MADSGRSRQVPTLEPSKLREIYRTMVLIRRFDERVLVLRAEGRIYGTVHPYVGQEGVAVGVCSALARGDRIASNHRGHGHSIAKGARVDRMMAELFGRRDGYCKGKGGSMHIADFGVGMLGANGIVSAGVPVAVGSALTAQMQGSDAVSVVFFGDGATGQGVLYESMNIAAMWKLPVVFVCENNRYASENRIELTLAQQTIAPIGTALGLPSLVVDGNDVLAVRDAALGAIAMARRGDGPSLLECRTFRWGVHSQRAAVLPDPRPAEEVESARLDDPIARFEGHLHGTGSVSDSVLRAIALEVEQTLDRAVDYAEASPFPTPEEAGQDLFA